MVGLSGWAGNEATGREDAATWPSSPERRGGIPASVFGGLLDSASNELSRVEEPLAAEVWASTALSVWDALGTGEESQRAFGDALVAYAEAHGGREAAALLHALAAVAPPGLDTRALGAADELERGGARPPSWAGRAGRAVARQAWVGRDLFGDQEVVIVGFAYPAGGEHTISVLIDHTLGGVATDAYPGASLVEVLPRWREAEAISLRRLPLREASARLAEALEASELHRTGSRRLGELRALLRARLRVLPAAKGRPSPGGGSELAPEAREHLVDDFLASPGAAGLLMYPRVRPICDSLLRYRCDDGDGDPLRWSPILVGLYLLDYLPRKVEVDDVESGAVLETLAAWVAWAGRRRGLPPRAVEDTLTAVARFGEKLPAVLAGRSRLGTAEAPAALEIDLTDEGQRARPRAEAVTRPPR